MIIISGRNKMYGYYTSTVLIFSLFMTHLNEYDRRRRRGVKLNESDKQKLGSPAAGEACKAIF